MIRAAIYHYLLIVGVVAIIAFFLADGHGGVMIVWRGYRIETSALALVVAGAVIAAPMVLLWSVIRAMLRSPTTIGRP